MYHTTETLVIGGGAIGVCCAYFLNQLGKKVTVVDKEDICSGCSYGNAGLIVPNHSIPLAAPGVIAHGLKWMFNPNSPFCIKPRFQQEFLSWLWQFHSACNKRQVRKAIPVLRDLQFASLDLFEELAVLEGIDFGFEKRGIIEIFKSHKGFEEAVKNVRLLNEYGVKNKILKSDELKQYTRQMPISAVGGIFYPPDAQIIPDRFVHQLARHIEQKGVDLLTAVEVLGFETAGRKIAAVKTTRGDITADEVVLSAGCWSSQITRELGIRLLLEAAKGYSVTYKRPSPCPEIPIAMAEAKVYLIPMNDTLRFAGTLELAGFDQSINLRRVQAILNAVPAYFPDMDPDSLELLEIWRGLRPCSPDGLPYLGRAPRYDNVILATGHGMLGISLAPITGKIVSQLSAYDNPAINLAALSVERFN